MQGTRVNQQKQAEQSQATHFKRKTKRKNWGVMRHGLPEGFLVR